MHFVPKRKVSFLLYKMQFSAVADLSPTKARARDYSKKDAAFGRLDSGIELDLGLQNSSMNFNFHEEFLSIRKGDVLRRIKVPNEKRLVYVEKVCKDVNANESFATDAVFCTAVDRSTISETVNTRGYVPVEYLQMHNGGVEADIASVNYCIDAEAGLEEALKLRAIAQKLEDENKQLKAQLHELKLTNDGLLDSLSWNGDDEQVSSFNLSPGSPLPSGTPRFLRSPRLLRARSRTTRSESPDQDRDIFLKILEKTADKQDGSMDEEIQLSCTLCSRKIRLTELEIHSKVCSSASACREVTLSIPDMLITTVTKVNHTSSTDQLLKLTTKTTLKSYDGHLFEVNRHLDDFLWFRDTLQLLSPARIVPALTMHGTVSGNFREVQRFLKRLFAHKVFKTHDFVREFLIQKDIAATRKRFDYKNTRRSNTSIRKPANKTCDQNSLLYRASVYISKLLKNLEGLANHFKDRMDRPSDAGEVSKRFGELSDGEVNETYLKIAASGLSRITRESSIKKEDCHESTLVEELESLYGNVKEAENLLKRVEGKRDNYLYWNEEMAVYEHQNDQKDKSPSQKTALSQKWAEASASCESAKASLENICKHLSEELHMFDVMKECDLKDILVEFANGQFQYYEKLQSKWHGVRIMLDTDLSPNKRGYDIV